MKTEREYDSDGEGLRLTRADNCSSRVIMTGLGNISGRWMMESSVGSLDEGKGEVVMERSSRYLYGVLEQRRKHSSRNLTTIGPSSRSSAPSGDLVPARAELEGIHSSQRWISSGSCWKSGSLARA